MRADRQWVTRRWFCVRTLIVHPLLLLLDQPSGLGRVTGERALNLTIGGRRRRLESGGGDVVSYGRGTVESRPPLGQFRWFCSLRSFDGGSWTESPFL